MARSNHITGKVFVGFVIERDGSLSNFKIVKSLSPECDKEVLRVIIIRPKVT
jgi:protein TonB